MKLAITCIILATIALVSFPVGCCATLGIGGFGPVRTVETKVISKHVDISGGESSSSHFMVTTERGTYEIDNGILLGVWNADELYGGLRPGQSYKLWVKGNRVVNFFFQEYPYVISAEQVPDGVTKTE